jgi:hypothetical protein
MLTNDVPNLELGDLGADSGDSSADLVSDDEREEGGLTPTTGDGVDVWRADTTVFDGNVNVVVLLSLELEVDELKVAPLLLMATSEEWGRTKRSSMSKTGLPEVAPEAELDLWRTSVDSMAYPLADMIDRKVDVRVKVMRWWVLGGEGFVDGVWSFWKKPQSIRIWISRAISVSVYVIRHPRSDAGGGEVGNGISRRHTSWGWRRFVSPYIRPVPQAVGRNEEMLIRSIH